MKKLLTALATAATAALGFAEIAGTEGFENSSYAAYGNDKPEQAAAYPFDGYGNYYMSLDDDGEEELLADDASCVDAVMQFKYADAPDGFVGDEKLVVFANSDGKLVVVDADATNVTTTAIAEDTWYRLTIVSVDETVNDATVKRFKVYVNGVLAEKKDDVSSFKSLFTSRVADSYSVSKMTLSGTGKVDNFVARTTNPFGGAPAGWIANIGTADPEQYFTDYTKALEKALAGATLTFADENVQMDGTAAHPFEIRSAADLKALQAAVADGNGADKCYVQTADIALTEAWPGIGVQNGKDLVYYTVGTASGDITQEEADRRDAKWSAGAFKGTYDGGNYTISNFQMVGVAGNPDSTTEGLDYCGFFNSVDGATIKNLKIAYAGSLFATDTTASTKESGATFVGVAKNSTLQNLTSLEGTVSCSKGFGGIVGYLAAGSSVESCTNNVNLTSLANNKVGGIAMICQQSNCSITDCKNNGTTTTESGEHGGIVGYADAITIDGCVNTAACKMFYHHGGTVTLSGANKGNATVASYTGVATPGLNFATVDGDVATFVADDALVLDGTVEYKVMNANAAYAFAAAGTLALDQSLATATVTADTSTLVLSDEIVDKVTTYTAVAGVASVGGVAYATLDEAVAALTSTDNELLILADLPTDVAPKVLAFEGDIVVKVADGVSFGMGLAAADGYMVSGLLPGADSVTYTVAVDTRKFKVISNGVATRYSTFKDAYGAAKAGDSLEGEIDGDIAIGSDYGDSKALASVIFTTTSEDPISVMTAYHYTAGAGYDIVLTASAWSVPANATLTLESQTVTSVAAGTLNVPDGVTLRTVDGGAFAGVSNLTGTGRVVVSETSPAGSLQALCQQQGWTGTLELANVDINSACNLTLFGNANSTVCFNNAGCALTANSNSAHAIGTLEIGANGFELIGNYAAGVFTLPCAVTGTGTFKVSAKNSAYGTDKKDVKFTGDVSDFTGNITFDTDANARVVFGTGTYPSTAAAKCIIVTPGTELTLPSAATWSAPTGIIVQGGLDVQGTLDVSANNIYGTGVIKFHDANKAVRVADSWEGTYRIDWAVPSGAFTIGDYGRKANGTIEIMQSPNSKAYPAPKKLTVVPTVKLSADWTVNDGWHSAVGESTFTKLTGSGNLTVNGTNSGNEDIWYTFTTLENYTGTLGGKRGAFKIGTLVSAVDPQPGAKIVSLAAGTREFRDLASTVVKYNNETVEVELEQKDDGIYVAVPQAAKVAEIVGGKQYETLAEAIAAATDGATVKLLADVALTETQTISKSVTLDLNGKNVTATDCRAFHVTAGTVAFTGTGTIFTVVTQGTNLASSSSVIRVGSNTAETNFTLGENVTVTSDYCYGITYFGTQPQTVAINGTVAVTGAQAAISGNGLPTMAAVTLTVGGAVSATQDYAIYNPQTGTTAITGTVTGGIEVKAGTVTVAGTATVTARNVTPSHSSNQDGTSTQGYAIASVGNSSYKQPAKVGVAAGATVTGSVIILKENNSETYGEITSAANTLTIPEGYVWNGPADGVYTLAVASGFDGGDGSATFSIDSAVQAEIAAVLPSGKTLESEVLRDPADETSGTGMTYAQAYALGLLDLKTGAVKDLKSSISFDANGKVVVSLAESPLEAYTVTLKVYTKSSLSAKWPAEATATYECGKETPFAKSDAAGFYKVEVVISGK